MQRIALSTLPLCALTAAVLLFLAPVAQAQDQEDVPEIKAVVGFPFSAVGIQENVRVTQDGNRFIHKFTTHHYRDGQGRTRLEREIPVQMAPSHVAANSPSETTHVMITINNKVTGEVDVLFPNGKVASVMQRPGMKVVDVPAATPEIFTRFGGMMIGPNASGWSAPVSLGEKSIEGLHAVGTQRTYTVTPGTVGNQKAVTITVQQWSSPDLGVILDKTARFSTGAEVHYQLQQILQAEPNADLFTVPADYKKMIVNPATGTVTASRTP
jgi:hypothetical protein